MRRTFIASLTLSLTVTLSVQQATLAGDRPGITKTHPLHAFAAMSGGRSILHPAVAISHPGAALQYSFSPVTPLVAKGTAPSQSAAGNEAPSRTAEADRAKQTGPATTPSERKRLTIFRLNPKFGDVSVQPVVGGVNGAQLSMGF